MSEKYQYHPIQLRAIKVLELSLVVNPEVNQDALPETDSFRFYHASSDYDMEDSTIAVKAGVVIEEDDSSPFELKIEIVGIFEVDKDSFPLEKIDDFASKNAPLLLYPYLREHVYSITSRADYPSVVLPLFVVPPFKIGK